MSRATADEWAAALAARLQEMGADDVARLRALLRATLFDAARGETRAKRQADAVCAADALGLGDDLRRLFAAADEPDDARASAIMRGDVEPCCPVCRGPARPRASTGCQDVNCPGYAA